ncbi:MAG: tail fiber domain-containing protein, partial [Pseudomonadota bacterium]|nr:tail fiber domain-containing protein [Pseudomonadota bacterium]
DAPAALKYRCTIHTGNMLGNIYIVGQHLANGADNRVVTATSAYGMNGEANMTFDGSTLTLTPGSSAGNITSLVLGRTSSAPAAQTTPVVKGGVPISGVPGILFGSENTNLPAIAFQTPNSSNGHIVFKPKGSETLRIDSNGRIQIGSTNSVSRNQFNGIGLLNLNNNNSDGTVDYTQGIVFTNNNSNEGTWTQGAIVTTGSSGYNGNLIFATDGDNSRNTTGLSEKMRLTHNGRIGLGTSDPDGMLHLKGGGPSIFLEDTDGTFGQSIIEQNSDDLKIRCDAGNASSGTGSNIMFQIDGQNSMRLMETASGSLLGIGGTPETGLDVVTNTANAAMDITTASQNHYQGDTFGDITLSRRASSTKHGTFGYSASMLDFRVTNSSHEWSVGQILGHVDPISMTNYAGGLSILVSRGGTQNPTGRRDKGEYPQAAALFTSKRIMTFSNESAQGTMVMHLSKNSAAANVQSDMIAFDVGGGGRGKIVSASSGSGTPSFGAYSDRRLKTNFRDYTGGYDRIKSIPVKLYDEVLNDQTKSIIIEPKKDVIGWIADEVQSVFPEAVMGTKDEIDSDGKPVYQSLTEGIFLPDAIQAIQKLIEKVETLEAEIAALKSS